MATKSTKFGFNLFLENDIVNFEELNDNFKKIEDLVLITESGVKSATYTEGSEANVKWYYRKYSDGTLEMWTKIGYSKLICETGAAGQYSSAESTINFPFAFSSIENVQMSLNADMTGYVVNTTANAVLDSLKLKVISANKESTDIFKQISINVKGVLDNGSNN